MNVKKILFPILSFTAKQRATHVGRWWGPQPHPAEHVGGGLGKLEPIPEGKALQQSLEMEAETYVPSPKASRGRKSPKPSLKSIPEDETVSEFNAKVAWSAKIEADSEDLALKVAETEALIEYHKFLEEMA